MLLSKKIPLCTMVFIFFFSLMLLVSMIFSLYIFKDVTATSTSTQSLMYMEYIRTKLKTGNFEVEQFGDDFALVDKETDYETIIYFYNGYVMELLADCDSDLGAEDGEILFPVNSFIVNKTEKYTEVYVDDYYICMKNG